MTIIGDNIQSGGFAATSAQASYAPVVLSRTIKIGGASNTVSFMLPTNVENFDASCYITQNGSAATSNSITVSAGGTDLIKFTSMGSAGGLIRETKAGLGTVTTYASACASVTTTAEVTAAATLVSVDAAATFQLSLVFNRTRTQVDV